MVLIRTPDSKIFEEAHLVLRADGGAGGLKEGDMLSEANRIIEAAGIGVDLRRRRRSKRGKRGGLGFLLGGLVGSGAVGAIWLVLSFL